MNNRLAYVLLPLLAFMLMAGMASAYTDTITSASQGQSLGSLTGSIRSYATTASHSGELWQLGIDLATCAGNYQIGLYPASGSYAGTPIIANTISVACTGNGWNYASVTNGLGSSIVQGTNYWIAYQVSSSSAYVWYGNGAEVTGTYNNTATYGKMPITAPWSAHDTEYPAYEAMVYNATVTANAITPSSPMVYSGQSVTLTAGATNGIPPYTTYQWYSQAACAGSVQSTGLTYLVSPGSTTTYSFKVTDTGSATACSANDLVTVSAGPSLTMSPSNVIGSPNTATLTGTCQSGDTCDIDYPSPGTHVATGTNSVTYTAPSTPGIFTYYANDITAGYHTANTLVEYVAVYTQNALANPASTFTASANTLTTQFPYRVYAGTTSNAVTYTLTQSFNSGGVTTVQSGVYNLSYVPSDGQSSGAYAYNVLETLTAGSYSLNLLDTVTTSNMVNVGGITYQGYSGNCIQYLPCNAMISVSPAGSYAKIVSDLASNQHGFVGTASNAIVFSNRSAVAYTPNVILAWGSPTSPWASYPVNVVNNPLLTSTTPVVYSYAVGTTGTGAVTRLLATVSTYSAYTLNPLLTTDTYSFNSLINNYTVGGSVTSTSANTFNVLMPNSAFSGGNPTIVVANGNMTSTAAVGSYYSQINNFFTSSYASGAWAPLSAYLLPTNSTGQYALSVYGCSGYATSDYLQINQYGSPSSTLIQQLYMTQFPFQINLLNGIQYQFNVYSSGKTLLYSSSMQTWGTPISLSTPCVSQIQPPPTYAQLNVTCWGTVGASNSIIGHCKGTDLANMVQSWTVKWTNVTSPVYQATMNTITTSSPTFSATYTFPANSATTGTYYAYVTALVGNSVTTTQSFGFRLNTGNIIVSGGIMGFFIVLLMLLCAFALSWYDKIAFLIIFDLLWVIIMWLGILPANVMTQSDFAFLIIGSGALIVIGSWKSGGTVKS